MQTLMSTINNDEPKWKLTESLIGVNPGLGKMLTFLIRKYYIFFIGFRPISDRVEEGSLIWYDTTNKTQIEYWVQILDRFLAREFIVIESIKV